jgi:hypothetical protein
MAFPSVLTTFNRPSTNDKQNSPSHSALHNTVSSALGQVEAVIGLADSASVLGTIIGDLRSPNSAGGGHVQTAVKGGTGQTSFNKGDILVATSSSVLSKLAVGTDIQILKANSGTAIGLEWGAPSSFSTTSVFNGTSANTFTDLNLSSVVGVAQRTVMLKAQNSNAGKLFVFRPNGDTADYYHASVLGANVVVTGASSIAGMAIVKTDTNGIVEWRTTNAENNCIISVESFW